MNNKQKIEKPQILRHLMEKCRFSDIRLFEPDLEETIKKIYGYKNEVPHKNWSKYLFATAIGIGYNMS